MPVYFIQNERGSVKIGHSVNPAQRLSLLQTGTEESLTLLRVIDGGLAVEKWLHKHFADRHIRGEWFTFCGSMLIALPPDSISRGPLIAAAKVKNKKSAPREIAAFWKAVSSRAHVDAFAEDIKVRKLTAHAWIRRGEIPSKHWPRIVSAATMRGFPVTWLMLDGETMFRRAA